MTLINPAEHTQEQIGMPLDVFLEEANTHPFDLINGKRMPLMPNASLHSDIVRVFFLALYAYSVEHSGEVYSETTFILPDAHNRKWVTGSRTPDAMFYVGQRLAEYKAATPDWRERPFAIVPDVVIEVISPTDKYSDVDEKIDAYLLDGVRLVIVIDPQRKKVTLHAPDLETPIILRGDARLEGGEVLPGFQIELAKLFV
jgi:Uma2 family endonuclease